MSNSNIYSKLQKARCEFQEKPLQKSGYNNYSNFYFFELKDVQPAINSLLEKYNLYSEIDCSGEIATLDIINSENPEERVTFKHRKGKVNLKACHEAQNEGAAATYARRYLWFLAFEIVENDAIDNGPGTEGNQGNPSQQGQVTQQEQPPKPNPKAKKINKLIATKNVNPEAVMIFAKQNFQVESYEMLNDEQADVIIDFLNRKENR